MFRQLRSPGLSYIISSSLHGVIYASRSSVVMVTKRASRAVQTKVETDQDVEIEDKHNEEQKPPVYVDQFQAALDHVLRLDPSLRETVDKAEFPSFLKSATLPPSFEYLVRGILSQQLSGLAAKAIHNKFLASFDGVFPTPDQLLGRTADELRAVGLSYRKAEYVQILAAAYKSGELSDEILLNATDDEVTDKLVSLKGMGPWTAQMFLLFYLRRPDVFSPGDLGIQRGFIEYMKRPGAAEIKTKTAQDVDPEHVRQRGTCKKALAKPPLSKEHVNMEAVASGFRPYRSAFQMILWRISDTMLAVERESGPSKSKSKSSNKKRKVKSDEDGVDDGVHFMASKEAIDKAAAESGHALVEDDVKPPPPPTTGPLRRSTRSVKSR